MRHLFVQPYPSAVLTHANNLLSSSTSNPSDSSCLPFGIFLGTQPVFRVAVCVATRRTNRCFIKTIGQVRRNHFFFYTFLAPVFCLPRTNTTDSLPSSTVAIATLVRFLHPMYCQGKLFATSSSNSSRLG